MFNPKGNQSTANEVSTDFRALFTGEVTAEVLAFNPDRERIIELRGLQDKKNDWVKAPDYVTVDNDGHKKIRLDIWFKFNPNELDTAAKTKMNKAIRKLNSMHAGDPDYTTQVEVNEVSSFVNEYCFTATLYLSDKEEVSKGGNKRFINNKNQSTWAKTLDVISGNSKMSWFNTETARAAKDGEVALYHFLQTWSNLKGDDKLDNFFIEGLMEDLADNDFEKLNNLVGSEFFSDPLEEDSPMRVPRGVTLLLGVKVSDSVDKEGNPYLNQAVYTSNYGSFVAKQGRSLSKKVRESATEYFPYIQDSFDFQVYDPNRVAMVQTYIDEPAATNTVDENYEDDDLPF